MSVPAWQAWVRFVFRGACRLVCGIGLLLLLLGFSPSLPRLFPMGKPQSGGPKSSCNSDSETITIEYATVLATYH